MSTLSNIDVVYLGRFCWSDTICSLGGTYRHPRWIKCTVQYQLPHGFNHGGNIRLNTAKE